MKINKTALRLALTAVFAVIGIGLITAGLNRPKEDRMYFNEAVLRGKDSGLLPRIDEDGDFFGHGYAVMRVYTSYEHSDQSYSYYMDKQGNKAFGRNFASAKPFAENGLAAAAELGEEIVYGYIDTDGEYVIKPKFQSAGIFRENGTATVSENGKYGVINETGEYIIPPEYDFINYDKEENVYYTENGDKKFLIADDGSEIKDVSRYSYIDLFSYEGLRVVRLGDNGPYGFIGKDGEEVIPCEYSYAVEFKNGYARVTKGDAEFFIDTNGNRPNNIDFVELDDAGDNGLAGAAAEKFMPSDELYESNYGQNRYKMGYIDIKTGKFVIEPQFCRTTPFKNGYAIAQDYYGKEWVIDEHGNKQVGGAEIIGGTYHIGNNLFLINGRLVDASGRQLYENDFYMYNHYDKNGLYFPVDMKSGLVGIMDSDGKMLCEPKFKKVYNDGSMLDYDHFYVCSKDGYILCAGDDGNYIADKNGNVLFDLNELEQKNR